MKISFAIIGTLAVSVALFSCSKEKTAPPTPVEPVMKPVIAINFNMTGADSMGQAGINGSWGVPEFVNDHKGNPGGALYFDGSDMNNYQFAPLKGQSFTMTAWVKMSGTSLGVQHFITIIHPVVGGVSFFQSGYALGTSVSVPGTDNTVSNDLDENWHHLAMTYDGKDIRLYIDGLLASTKNHPGSVGDDLRGMSIGGLNGDFWKGTIDDFRVYNTVFTPETINKLAAL